MKNADSHIILYAKNWYQRFNHVKDMQIILAHRSGISDIEMITNSDIVIVLSKLVILI